MTNKVIIFFTAFFCIIPSVLSAKYQFEVTPSISIAENYDDNIDLTKNNLKSDWITSISPKVDLNIKSETSKISLSYAPILIRYKNEDQRNTIGHSGTLIIGGNLSNKLLYEFEETYLMSDDPIEQTEGIYDIRHNRNSYQRNSEGVNTTFIFGPDDAVKCGYNYSFLKNKDSSLYDNKYSNPVVALTFGVNKKNKIEFNYGYVLANFSRDDKNVPGNNYSGNAITTKYTYRLNSISTTSFAYSLNTRSFDNSLENYNVHHGTIDFTHSFSGGSTISLIGGYFLVKNKFLSDDNGYSCDISFTKNFSRVGFSISGSEGWREGYLEADRMGLLKYLWVDSKFSYQATEKLKNNASIFYMSSKQESDGRRFKTYNAHYGWTLSFFRWYALSIDYSHEGRNDDVDLYDFVDNRVMMSLTMSRLFK
jgi:hypothetical protein